ncbi:hypothetical protein VNO78_27303 [Psophocarpus tetragonolobus]|uniref:Uncharacterized protein n=1 Tax=Psophocarpus tetragonolobus TaxID=3891 RepID=A0AAN9S0T1_PSOTE
MNSQQTPSVSDALAYLMIVKETLEETEKIDIESVITIVKELFKGHRDLLMGFNVFLPKKHEITLAMKDEQPLQIDAIDEKSISIDDAVAYVKKVRATLQDEKGKCQHFLEILNDFKTQRIDMVSAIARVKELFKGHRDLIEGFNVFLAKKHKIKLPLEDEQQPPQEEHVEFAEDINFMGKMKAQHGRNERLLREGQFVANKSFKKKTNSSFK